jgi:hypothetical protein
LTEIDTKSIELLLKCTKSKLNHAISKLATVWFSSCVVQFVAKKSLSGINPMGLLNNIDSYMEKLPLAQISEFWVRRFFTT